MVEKAAVKFWRKVTGLAKPQARAMSAMESVVVSNSVRAWSNRFWLSQLPGVVPVICANTLVKLRGLMCARSASISTVIG